MRVHFDTKRGTACGVPQVSAAHVVRLSTPEAATVTCKSCKRAWDYRETLAVDDPRRTVTM